ncbi:MAG: Xaa-Pro dipeptidase [Marinobacter sp.]|uniref:Xaa-Pro dipeptidase n=1 Tax=Marinobacter sp. TaxID=50741 RepID=UPI00299E3A87|nr:Xaa-Pro dipeptidase [Marinobacter sp.]MDX1755213.1 Xaa-Pro dipeptidase [Marinobacter sp.]
MDNENMQSLQCEHIDSLQRRYSEAMANHQYDALLIGSGAAPLRYADDQAYPYQGFGPFVHWTGWPQLEHSWLLVQPGAKPRLWVHAADDFWHVGVTLPDEPWLDGLEVELTAEAGAPNLARIGRLAVVGDPACLTGVPGDHNPADLLASLDATRARKTAYEVLCLEQANARAAEGHRAARRAFLAGGSEFEVRLAYQAATRQGEALAPYPSIIGLNGHAGILHYQLADTEPPEVSRSLLIDAGYRYRGYGSDITRTTAAVGQGRFQALVAVVESLQRRLCEAVVPGVDFVDLHRKAHLGLAALLSAADLVRGLDEAAMVAAGITRAFFPHGLGHLLGVQVHDVSGRPSPPPVDAPFLRCTRTLEPGMVVTVEPGLYFIPSLLDPLLGSRWGRHRNLTRAHLP